MFLCYILWCGMCIVMVERVWGVWEEMKKYISSQVGDQDYQKIFHLSVIAKSF
ncbi:hypothetical protein [Okeania sp. SIO2B3]|uniref:hypothetical protein n=1 Tax=Okeania sp. SIO2B3 TaxID=2607784 RepID=UPI0025F174C6|nr:hypothetical protein [Okeania sp. SIO2B3]